MYGDIKNRLVVTTRPGIAQSV